MPRLPNVDAAFIEAAKLADYLLNVRHTIGGPKATFFMSFGFTVDRPEVLEKALLEHARRHEATAKPTTVHGQKFEIVGPLDCPDGRLPVVVTVWIIDTGTTAPRLVTAYPG